MKRLILIITLFQTLTLYGQTNNIEKYDKEPLSTFEVTINGKNYTVWENEELNLNEAGKSKIVIKQSPTKKFENSSFKFDYPRNMSFEFSKEPAIRTWTLTGNNVVIMLFEMDVESTLESFVENIVEKFGTENCKVESQSKTLGNKTCAGKTITVNIIEQTILYDCYSYKSDSGLSRFIFFQDSGEELKHSKDYMEILALINRTITYK